MFWAKNESCLSTRANAPCFLILWDVWWCHRGKVFCAESIKNDSFVPTRAQFFGNWEAGWESPRWAYNWALTQTQSLKWLNYSCSWSNRILSRGWPACFFWTWSKVHSTLNSVSTLGCSQVVRQLFLVQCTVGSNPTIPATYFTPVLHIVMFFAPLWYFKGCRRPHEFFWPFFNLSLLQWRVLGCFSGLMNSSHIASFGFCTLDKWFLCDTVILIFFFCFLFFRLFRIKDWNGCFL